eukprot:GEMP01115558.1.p1 GENE.GEMP01115558.1~~GEMP01115558.1.p1  ORF type:complete len:214 (+),score=34.39 GEMP01115558.1:23-643(+)
MLLRRVRLPIWRRPPSEVQNVATPTFGVRTFSLVAHMRSQRAIGTHTTNHHIFRPCTTAGHRIVGPFLCVRTFFHEEKPTGDTQNQRYGGLKEHERLPGGRQPQKDFRMGPYAHKWKKTADGKLSPVGTWIVSPRKDPVTFVVNCLIIFIMCYTIANLSWGESYMEKRRRVLRERIRQEFDLPEHWDSEIEDDDEPIEPLHKSHKD